MLTWLKDSAPFIAALAGTLLAFAAVLRFVVVEPMYNRFDDQDKYIDARFDAVDQRFDARFDAVDQRFDAVNQRFDDLDRSINQRFDVLTTQVAELRSLIVGIIERVSRNEGRIDLLTEQLQTIDAPAP